MSTPAGPPRPGSWLATSAPDLPAAPLGSGVRTAPAADGLADDVAHDLAASLAGLPVAAHADVLTAEHDRLHRLLATIDQL